jgi:hypothetical protein
MLYFRWYKKSGILLLVKQKEASGITFFWVRENAFGLVNAGSFSCAFECHRES